VTCVPPNIGLANVISTKAFGVVLLEVGLWEPIMNVVQRQAGKQLADSRPPDVKNWLLNICSTELEHKCGTRYRKMIEKCLTCQFGIDSQQDTKLQAGVQAVFREEIMEALKEEQIAVAAKIA
jgi:hypothetical protein